MKSPGFIGGNGDGCVVDMTPAFLAHVGHASNLGGPDVQLLSRKTMRTRQEPHAETDQFENEGFGKWHAGEKRVGENQSELTGPP